MNCIQRIGRYPFEMFSLISRMRKTEPPSRCITEGSLNTGVIEVGQPANDSGEGGRVAQVTGEREGQLRRSPEGAPLIRMLFASEWEE